MYLDTYAYKHTNIQTETLIDSRAYRNCTFMDTVRMHASQTRDLYLAHPGLAFIKSPPPLDRLPQASLTWGHRNDPLVNRTLMLRSSNMGVTAITLPSDL